MRNVAVVTAMLLMSFAGALHAQTPSASTFVVSTLADSGPGSLRDAIVQANAGNCSHCEIVFVVAGDIAPLSPLPIITAGGLTINGYSAPGASPNTNPFGQPNNAVIKMGLSGANGVSTGFRVDANNVVIRGFAIHGFTGGSGRGITCGSSSSDVVGNFIGTDMSGNAASPNDVGVVAENGAHLILGSASPADFNVISGNKFEGVLSLPGAVNTKLVGNTIGLRADGSGALPNQTGVSLGSHSVKLGDGTGGNIISGNTLYGVYTTAGSHNILRNRIGTNGTGTAAIPNGTGIYGAGASGLAGSTIGGNTAADGNVISGNTGDGIRIETTGGASLYNNKIGVQIDGVTPLANGGAGVNIAGGSGVVVGDPTRGNVIAYNSGAGIVVNGNGTRNVFRGNSTHSNLLFGIDLGGDGITPNDPGDPDTGANNRQNFATVDSVAISSTIDVTASFDSSAVGSTAAFIIDFYDAGPFGQGRTYLGNSGCVAGNSLSGGTYSLPMGSFTPGNTITATATSYADAGCLTANDGTSEFSAAVCTPPAVTITPSASHVCPGNPTTLDAGAGFTSYLWSTGATTRTITVNPTVATSYSVTVTNSVGCSNNASTMITIDPLPASAITPDGPTSFCIGGSVTLTATPAGSYLWSTGATTQSITVSSSGSYSVNVTDGNGCSATSAPTVVTVNPLPTPSVAADGPTTFCAGGSVNLTALPAGASYLWSNGAVSQTINVTAGGSYSVNVTDGNGCSATSAPTVVTVNPLPTPSVAADGPTTFCAGGSVNLTALPAGASYLWSNGAVSQSINVTAGGSYSVVVTDGNGCSASSSPTTVTVNALPDATITAPSSICANSSSSASVPPQPGATYAWTVGNGSLLSGNGTNSITFAAGGSGPVTFGVTVTLNGCISNGNASTAVGVFTPSIAPSGPTTFCAGGSVTLTASSGASYLWSTGATTQSITVNSSGSYSVTVNNGSNCSGSAAPVNVTVNPNPTVTITGPTSICPNSSTTLDAGAGFASYLWSTGATTRTITVSPSAPTTYSVTATTAAGCSGNASATVSFLPLANATITAPDAVEAGSTGNTASVPSGPAGTTYAWSITNGTIASGQGTSSITWNADTVTPVTLHVTATTGGGCSTSGQTLVGIAGQADLALTANAPGSVTPGSSFSVVLSPSNSGPSTAFNVAVNATVPADFTINSITAPGWSCNKTGGAVSCGANAGLTSGIGTITLNLTAPAAAGGYDIHAAIGSATPDTHTANDAVDLHIAVGAVSTGCGNIAPTLLAPGNLSNGVGNPVNFAWSSVPNATRYELWVASHNAAPSLAASTSLTNASVPLPPGSATFYVVAYTGEDCPPLLSARRTFNVAKAESCHPSTPQLISPVKSSIVSSPVSFSWKTVPEATQYRLWVSQDGEPMQDIALTSETKIDVFLTPGGYAWYIEALFPGCDATQSDLGNFTIPAKDPCADRGVAPLASPSDTATNSGSKVEFKWASVPNNSGYRVWASVEGGPFAALGTTPATQFTAFIGRGKVEWFVETLFDGCASTESEHRKLTVPTAAFCGDSTATLVAPSEGMKLTAGDEVTFGWSAVPGAVSYEVWVALANNSPVLLGATDATTLTLTMPPGSFEWFVRTIVAGCAAQDSKTGHFSFTPPANCSTQRPIPILPVDNARSMVSPVDISWSKVAGAVSYDVYMSFNHAAPVLVGNTSDLHLDRVAVPVGPVEWYVLANFANCPSQASTPSMFTVIKKPAPCSSLDTPSLRTPAEASSDVRYTIRWSNVAAAQLYELEESSTQDFSGAASYMSVKPELGFAHANPGPQPIPYYYRVRSVSGCNGTRSLFSDVAVVTIQPVASGNASSIHGASPTDDPQTLHHTLTLGANGNGPSAAAVGDSFSVTTTEPWLTVSPSSGTISAGGVTLEVTVDTSGLPFGVSNAAIKITTKGSSNATTGRKKTLDDPPVATTNVSVNMAQPVSSNPKSTPPPDALIFAAVAHADGANSKFQSDVKVSNTSPKAMKYQLTFTPSGEDGLAAAKQTTLDVDAGKTVALEDLLPTWFGSLGSSTGALEVRPLTVTANSTSGQPRNGLPAAVTFAASRMYNLTAAGTFGQYIPPTAYANFISKIGDAASASAQSLQQVAQSNAFRTNLGLIEGSGDTATVQLSVFNPSGNKLTEFQQILHGGQHLQLNRILEQRGLTSLNDGRVEARVIAGGGKVTTYASVVDNNTNDSLLVSPVSIKSLGAAKYVVPGVADSNGVTNWRSDLRIFNAGDTAVNASVVFYPQDGPSQTKQVTVNAHEVKNYDSALQSLFGVANQGGAVQIVTSEASPLVATARTYNQTANGSFGQFVPAVTPDQAAGRDSRALQLLQVEESSRYRTNLGFAEMNGKPAKVEVTVVPPNSKVAAVTSFDLPANGFRQFNSVLTSLGLTNTYNARVSIKVIGGDGKITAYASVIDLDTGDPTYIPAQ